MSEHDAELIEKLAKRLNTPLNAGILPPNVNIQKISDAFTGPVLGWAVGAVLAASGAAGGLYVKESARIESASQVAAHEARTEPRIAHMASNVETNQKIAADVRAQVGILSSQMQDSAERDARIERYLEKLIDLELNQ